MQGLSVNRAKATATDADVGKVAVMSAADTVIVQVDATAAQPLGIIVESDSDLDRVEVQYRGKAWARVGEAGLAATVRRVSADAAGKLVAAAVEDFTVGTVLLHKAAVEDDMVQVDVDPGFLATPEA